MWTKICRNAFSSLSGTAISLAVGFFLMPFTVRRIGATGFGIWVLANSVVGYTGLLDLGLAPTLVKKSAEYLHRVDDEGRLALRRIVSTTFFLYVVLGAVLGLVIAALALLPDGAFKIPARDLNTFRLVLLVVGLQASLNLPMSVWSGIVAGLQDFHFLNGLNFLANLARASLTVALLLNGFGLLSLVIMGFAVSCFSWTSTWLWVRFRVPHLRVRLDSFSRLHVRELAHFSGAMVMWSVAGYALHSADRLILGLFTPVAAITTYEIGARTANYSRNVLHSWLSIFMPASSVLNARNDRAMLRELYARGTKYLLLSYAAVGVPLLCFGRQFVLLWMGRDFSAAAWVLMFLMIGNLYQSQNLVAHVMLPGMNRLRAFTAVMSVYPVVTAVLGALLVRKWGPVGMAAALAATIVLVESAFLPYILRLFELSMLRFLRECILPAALSCVPSLAWIWLVRAWLPATTWPRMVFDVAGSLVAYAAGFWVLGASREERRALLAKPRELFRSFIHLQTESSLMAEDHT